MIDGLLGDLEFRVHSLFVAGVRIAVPHGEVAARDMHSDAMTLPKDIGGRKQIDRVLVGSVRLEQDWRFPDGLSEPGAEDAFGEVEGAAVRVDVDEACNEVRVAR